MLDESYKLNWGGADRVSVTFTGKALVSVESGDVAIGEYTEGSTPDKDGLVIHWNRPPYGAVVEGTVGFYNVSNAADGSRADVRIQPYTE